jgi:hypothetical protein
MLRTSLDRRILDVVSPERTFTGAGAHCIVACKWLPSPSARYAVVRASTCECARSARAVRDQTVQTRLQYRSDFANQAEINDAEDSIRKGQWPLRTKPGLIICRVSRHPFCSPASPIRTRIAYLILRILCSRKSSDQKTRGCITGGEQSDEENCHSGRWSIGIATGIKAAEEQLRSHGRQRSLGGADLQRTSDATWVSIFGKENAR